MTTELPPTYNEAIQGFVPPPEYHSSASNNASNGSTTVIPTNSMARESYYTSTKLNLVMLDDCNEDPRDVERLEVPNTKYIVKTDDELQDLYHSIYTIVEDKFIQVKRNTEFVHKKIRSMYNHYYINQLRDNTMADFLKIKAKLQKELDSLPQIFEYYKQFNSVYETVTNEITAIKFELEHAIDGESHMNEGELLSLSSNLTTKTNLQRKVLFNLNQMDKKVKELSDTEEVSYVLKERARVYNMATDFVRNQ